MKKFLVAGSAICLVAALLVGGLALSGKKVNAQVSTDSAVFNQPAVTQTCQGMNGANCPGAANGSCQNMSGGSCPLVKQGSCTGKHGSCGCQRR